MKTLLGKYGVEAGLLIGGRKKGENKEAIKLFTEGKIRVLLGTSVADEGLDIKRLDTVLICNPCATNAGLLKQRIGRCERVCEGKKDAMAIYFLDNLVFPYHSRLIKNIYPEVKNLTAPPV